jgi:hypothetical protein
MRIALVLLFVVVPLVGQAMKNPPMKESCACNSDPGLLYRPVVHEMWARDEGEHPFKLASGFIRIAVHPAFEPEFFFDVVLNRNGSATITSYSLPKGVKSITALVRAELKRSPDATITVLASKLPVERHKFSASTRVEQLIEQFFALQLAARRIPNDIITLDSTEYEMEFVGDDHLLFSSDDDEAPMVKWIGSFLAAARDKTQHEGAAR